VVSSHEQAAHHSSGTDSRDRLRSAASSGHDHRRPVAALSSGTRLGKFRVLVRRTLMTLKGLPRSPTSTDRRWAERRCDRCGSCLKSPITHPGLRQGVPIVALRHFVRIRLLTIDIPVVRWGSAGCRKVRPCSRRTVAAVEKLSPGSIRNTFGVPTAAANTDSSSARSPALPNGRWVRRGVQAYPRPRGLRAQDHQAEHALPWHPDPSFQRRRS
jgi:hypothetical protein